LKKGEGQKEKGRRKDRQAAERGNAICDHGLTSGARHARKKGEKVKRGRERGF